MTATERPSLEARAREWLGPLASTARTESLTALLNGAQSEERAFADIRLQTAVTTMEQATQAMLEAQAEVVELRAALHGYATGVDEMSWHGEAMRCELCHSHWNNGCKRGEPATPETHKPDCLLARPQPEAILRVLRAAVKWQAGIRDPLWQPTEVALYEAVRALPEGVREVLK